MEKGDKYNAKKYNQYAIGKIQCVLCKGFYKKICSHVVQKHDITSKEYKQLLGKDTKKGLICNTSRAIAQARNKENYKIVVKENLIKKGTPSRFKKGQTGIGKYKRSKQTIERLKKHILNI